MGACTLFPVERTSFQGKKTDPESNPVSIVDINAYGHQFLQFMIILKTGFEKSPMFQGPDKGLGPRYCPSIEDRLQDSVKGKDTTVC